MAVDAAKGGERVDKLRRLILSAIGLVVMCVGAPIVSANEEPYVLIQDVTESHAGRTVYSVNFGYSPQAFSGQFWDVQGQPYVANTLMREWSVVGAARKNWSDRWTVVFSTRYNRLSVLEERLFATHREEVRTLDSTWGVQLGIQGKLQSDHPLDPRIGFNVALPEQTIDARLGLSMVRDPMVLSGILGYGKDLKADGDTLVAGFGLGFVANDVLSVGVNMQHLMAIETWAPPTNSLSLAVGYVLDPTRGRQVHFETSFWSDGERFVVSFGMGWTARGA